MTDVLTAGTVFAGRYELQEVVDMPPALLYGQALDQHTGKNVVLHLFVSHVSGSERWREVFYESATPLLSLPALGQPAILDRLVVGDVACLVSEALEGERLITPGTSQTASSVVAWGLDIASLLSQFHELSPPVFGRSSRYETLWIRPDRQATILRFGVPEPPVGTTVTTGVSAFQAPETFGNSTKMMTSASDVYWMGSCMYLALHGQPPPSGLQRAAKQTPLVRPADVPDDLWTLLMDMVTFKPSERPPASAVYKRMLMIRC